MFRYFKTVVVILNDINNELIDLRNDINRKEIPENENPKKTSQHC